jgi:hypothetical protein
MEKYTEGYSYHEPYISQQLHHLLCGSQSHHAERKSRHNVLSPKVQIQVKLAYDAGHRLVAAFARRGTYVLFLELECGRTRKCSPESIHRALPYDQDICLCLIKIIIKQTLLTHFWHGRL